MSAVRDNLLICLIVVYALLGVAVAFNVLNYQVPIFNPQDPPATKFISIDYPETILAFTKNDMIHINVLLTTVGMFVGNQFVNLDATGTMSNRAVQEGIAYVYVGFEGASQVINGSIGIPAAGEVIGGAELAENATYGTILVPQTADLGPTTLGTTTQTIVWTTEGNYYPTLFIFYRNGTIVPQAYPDFIVHVNSVDVLLNERYNRINEVLTIALVIFGFVEGAKAIHDFASPKDARKG
jgi:hypothetical protein